jgi:hypothetical protein
MIRLFRRLKCWLEGHDWRNDKGFPVHGWRNEPNPGSYCARNCGIKGPAVQ